jgi:hypothetical protein
MDDPHTKGKAQSLFLNAKFLFWPGFASVPQPLRPWYELTRSGSHHIAEDVDMEAPGVWHMAS